MRKDCLEGYCGMDWWLRWSGVKASVPTVFKTQESSIYKDGIIPHTVKVKITIEEIE
jgi:hypothetical protein